MSSQRRETSRCHHIICLINVRTTTFFDHRDVLDHRHEHHHQRLRVW